MLPFWAPNPHFSNEFLETNGIGGFASGTASGAVSRRYHAFLCAATKAPQERRILVSKIGETLRVGDETFALDANFWHETIAPRGDENLVSFALDPLPRWVFRVETALGTLEIEKTLWMIRGQNTTVARYKKLRGPDAILEVRPFVTGRDYHSTHRHNPEFNAQIGAQSPSRVAIAPYSHLPAIQFDFSGEFRGDGHWYFGFRWPLEEERGLDAREDAFSPGVFSLELRGENPAFFAASTDGVNLDELENSRLETVERRRALGGGGDWNAPENRLRRAADQFLVRREDGLFTILAGYHWFTDWGRDTMIALPGLCLSTRRHDVAASVLRAFASAMSQGMIPNRFPDAGETPDYNTVDGTLWFYHAIGEFWRASGDLETVRELYPKMVEGIEWHLAGTRFGIRADEGDGMLVAGDERSQLTWMDAKIGEVAFTPRAGKPVEIQALWFNALCETALVAKALGDDAMSEICREWSRKIATHFSDLFWNAGENCLYDFIAEDTKNGLYRDGAIRPNQIFAVSLPHRLLCHEREVQVVECVERELLTPHGLRSLSPRDSRYRGTYIGDSWARDSAYHQGTVWAWPAGAFFEAYLRAHGASFEAKTQVKNWLAPLISHLDSAGIGSISEIFDGDAPHAPRGCIAQAWSVSEILRIWEQLGA